MDDELRWLNRRVHEVVEEMLARTEPVPEDQQPTKEQRLSAILHFVMIARFHLTDEPVGYITTDAPVDGDTPGFPGDDVEEELDAQLDTLYLILRSTEPERMASTLLEFMATLDGKKRLTDEEVAEHFRAQDDGMIADIEDFLSNDEDNRPSE